MNKLDSVRTQLPYDYYSLPFCRPAKIQEENENLGEILSGDRIETSLYQIEMSIVSFCKILCRTKLGASDLAAFSEKIKDEYRVNWIVDNLPAATKYFTTENDSGQELEPHYEKGFELGFTRNGKQFVNNHARIILFFHGSETYSGYRIVGFEVEAFSVKHEIDGEWQDTATKLKTCNTNNIVTVESEPQSVSDAPKPGETVDIIWTYDVTWKKSNIKWAMRWDLYLKMTDSQIHWFSIINSIMIVLFLSGMIAMIMMRTLHRDLLAYNQEDDRAEAQQEESGWKLIYSEVFRPPAHASFLCVLLGSGVQIFFMSILTLVFAVLGFLSPANRGGLMTALLLLFVMMGSTAGYASTRMFKFFKLTEWKRNTFVTAVFFPGVCFSLFFVLNLLVWGEKSTGAVPFGTLVALLVLWFGISVPLVYFGSYLAYKKPAMQPPVTVNHIPRMIPDQPWYMHPNFSMLVGGVLPFGAVFIEIFFIMSSVWLNQFYYLFGFLAIVFCILVITCAEITIVMCYFQLCGEDYHWWWRSFMTSGSSALYLFIYSILYFFTKLEIIKLIPALLFFGYMLACSFAFFLLTGTIGFFACFFFIYKIYSSIKVE